MDEPPAHSSFLETARSVERLASQAGFKREGTVGAGSNAGPHYFVRGRMAVRPDSPSGDRRNSATNRCAAVPVRQTRLDLGHFGGG